MDWTKVPTDLIIDRRTDNEITAIVKYQLLWAFFEEEPSMEKALRYMTKKQYELATSYQDSIKKCVTSDILHVIKKRGSEKKRYNKNKDLGKILDARQDNGMDTNLDAQIREDKIREEKYPKDFETFWDLYPRDRRGNKEKAYKSYCNVLKDKRSTPEELVKIVKIYSQSREVKEGYAKGCAAWLNDDRFNCKYQVVGVVNKNQDLILDFETLKNTTEEERKMWSKEQWSIYYKVVFGVKERGNGNV